MKLTREALLEKIKEFIGDRTDDAAISLLEDVSDSVGEADVSEYEKRIADLESEKDALELSWRKKYIDRFQNGNQVQLDEEEKKIEAGVDTNEPDDETDPFDEIFTESEDDS